ncbi:MAG: hypothetical protein JJU01_02190 [Alkalibacterium sp.]|nr:hypothetical protein [Alkalibacterium sp.]TVP91224.1 MAG: hypothetical protein EA249_05715 [Alkalibacterium sp.]
MSETAVIYMSNGKTYTVDRSLTSVSELINDSKTHSEESFYEFTLLNGKKVLVNPVHVVAVETSELSNMDASSQDSTTPVEKENKKKANLKAARKFKDDIDGNME